MIRKRTGLTVLILIGLARMAGAQATVTPGEGVREPSVDVSRLPINLARIQKQLLQSTVREERDGLNLRYVMNVYGQAPRIELFTKQDNLLTGPVPYGGPTHRDILQVITPQEHRSPAADFGGLFRWLSGKTKDKGDKK